MHAAAPDDSIAAIRRGNYFALLRSKLSMRSKSLNLFGRFAAGSGRAFIVMLALAALQASYAGHQFEHSAGDITTACSVCLQFDRPDDINAGEPPVIDSAANLVFPVPAQRADACFRPPRSMPIESATVSLIRL